MPKLATFWDFVNLRFFNNQIGKKQIKEILLTRSWIDETPIILQ